MSRYILIRRPARPGFAFCWWAVLALLHQTHVIEHFLAPVSGRCC